MAKFECSVELDFLEDGDNLDKIVLDTIVHQISEKVIFDTKERVNERVEKIINEKLSATIDERLNGYLDEFLSTPRNITNSYGSIVEKDVTVEGVLKKRLDGFLSERVSKDGATMSNGSISRFDFIVNKKIDIEFNRALESAVDGIRKEILNRINNTVRGGIAQKIIDVAGINELFSKEG